MMNCVVIYKHVMLHSFECHGTLLLGDSVLSETVLLHSLSAIEHRCCFESCNCLRLFLFDFVTSLSRLLSVVDTGSFVLNCEDYLFVNWITI